MRDCCSTNTKVQTPTCCSFKPEWVLGNMETSAGEVQCVSTEWSWADRIGLIKSRISAFRMHYSVSPGLYAVGEPDEKCDVFVTANYKLSFDILRVALKGLNAWVLILDTQGINVWCAAGKGTFGAEELIRRIRECQLDKIVNHKRVIVPQLGASGVSAHRVRQESGFRVCFGPVYARDIPAYLCAGYKSSREMRTIKFSILDRLALTPMEILPAMKHYFIYALLILVIFGFQPGGFGWEKVWAGGSPFLFLGLVSIFSGVFITPLLLPFIPSRAFALKGWITGMILIFTALRLIDLPQLGHGLLVLFSYLFFPAVSSYLALQFTGSTPFTGRSGVEKELKTAVPVYITALSVSLILIIVYQLKQWGVV